MSRLFIIVGLCFFVGFWIVSKLMKINGAGSFQDGMRFPSDAADSASAMAPGTERATLENWHLILGVSRAARMEEIRAAYKRQMSLYHPDKVATLGEELRTVATAKSKQINAAYDLAVRYAAR